MRSTWQGPGGLLDENSWPSTHGLVLDLDRYRPSDAYHLHQIGVRRRRRQANAVGHCTTSMRGAMGDGLVADLAWSGTVDQFTKHCKVTVADRSDHVRRDTPQIVGAGHVSPAGIGWPATSA